MIAQALFRRHPRSSRDQGLPPSRQLPPLGLLAGEGGGATLAEWLSSTLRHADVRVMAKVIANLHMWDQEIPLDIRRSLLGHEHRVITLHFSSPVLVRLMEEAKRIVRPAPRLVGVAAEARAT